MTGVRQILSVAKNRHFEKSLDRLGAGEAWRIKREIEHDMDCHVKNCPWCVDVGCEEFNSLLIKHTAARHRLGIN